MILSRSDEADWIVGAGVNEVLSEEEGLTDLVRCSCCINAGREELRMVWVMG